MAVYENPYTPPKSPKQKNGFATASLICGMLGLLNLCCFAFPSAIVFGVGAISFAVISKKDQRLTTPARIAIFLGSGAIVFGVAEYFYALNLIEYMKEPANIALFNQLYEQAEKLLEEQALLGETITY
ncbi:MAG: hypothetical protein IJ374_06125 [Lachnospiraceae bacterium]|nr:hypothetical protein [Lachnospiraceae bacterium]